MANAFFYGTLMHPKVLQHVIEHPGADLQICSAVLLDHTRHKVKKAEYPGMIPYEQTRLLLGHEIPIEERCVRGTLVTGLSEEDISVLDEFEGPEYERRGVDVHPLAEPIKLSEYAADDEKLIPSHPPPLPQRSQLPTAKIIRAETYIFKVPTILERDLWSFENFVKNNARKWYSTNDARWAELEEGTLGA